MENLPLSWVALDGSSVGEMTLQQFVKQLHTTLKGPSETFLIQGYFKSGEPIAVRFFCKSTTPSSSSTQKSAKQKSSRKSSASSKSRSNSTEAVVSSSRPRQR
jgi:DNA-binding winged helix-turn-helix (wHTH) protein